MSNSAVLARRLSELLCLTDAPVAVSFDAPREADAATSVPAQPAGCCFWEPAQRRRLDTVAADHANCSVGSYTHGLIPLEQAAGGADTAALVRSGWVGEADLMAAAALPFRPSAITYQPLADAVNPDVVLVRLSPSALMTLLGAVPDLHCSRVVTAGHPNRCHRRGLGQQLAQYFTRLRNACGNTTPRAGAEGGSPQGACGVRRNFSPVACLT